jgi:hypothetical protein
MKRFLLLADDKAADEVARACIGMPGVREIRLITEDEPEPGVDVGPAPRPHKPKPVLALAPPKPKAKVKKGLKLSEQFKKMVWEALDVPRDAHGIRDVTQRSESAIYLALQALEREGVVKREKTPDMPRTIFSRALTE